MPIRYNNNNKIPCTRTAHEEYGDEEASDPDITRLEPLVAVGGGGKTIFLRMMDSQNSEEDSEDSADSVESYEF